MEEKACKNCRLLISHGDSCPLCGSTELTTKWSGYAIILNAEKEENAYEKRRKIFAPFQVNAKVLSYAKPDVSVMHPLPAHRGEEISTDVIDGPKSIVWEQAKNKLTIAKALLLYLSEND